MPPQVLDMLSHWADNKPSNGSSMGAMLVVSLFAAAGTPLEVLKDTTIHKKTAAASVIEIAVAAKLCCKEVEGFLIS